MDSEQVEEGQVCICSICQVNQVPNRLLGEGICEDCEVKDIRNMQELDFGDE